MRRFFIQRGSLAVPDQEHFFLCTESVANFCQVSPDVDGVYKSENVHSLPLLFLLNTAIVPVPVGLERQRHLIRQRKSKANPDINSRCAERGMQVDDGFSVPQLYPPTGKVVVWHPAGKGMRKRFPEPPMIIADRIGFVTGNGKAQQFSVHRHALAEQRKAQVKRIPQPQDFDFENAVRTNENFNKSSANKNNGNKAAKHAAVFTVAAILILMLILFLFLLTAK